MTQWNPHITVAAIIEHENQFLMVEERINNQLVINQAAGHWEKDESLIQAVKRETLEETSYLVEPDYLIGIYNWTIPHNENTALKIDTFLRFTFKCNLISKTDNPIDPDIQRYLWLNENEIRSAEYKKRSPLVLKSLDDFLVGKKYPLDQFIDIK